MRLTARVFKAAMPGGAISDGEDSAPQRAQTPASVGAASDPPPLSQSERRRLVSVRVVVSRAARMAPTARAWSFAPGSASPRWTRRARPRRASSTARSSSSAGNNDVESSSQPPPASLTVVGKGRVGSALGRMATTAGSSVTFVTRDDGPEAFGAPGPILVATHASDLDAVLAKVPPIRHRDLILLQGGLLREPWLARRGLSDVTQAALYLSARADGSFSDGGGATVAAGPLASVIPRVLVPSGVAARAVPRESFPRVALEKLLWTSIFWLLCDVRGETVGEVVADPEGVESARTLARELVRVATQSDRSADEFSPARVSDEDEDETETEFIDDVVDGLVAYSRAIPTAVPSREMALRETGFRNGWFLLVGGGAEAQPSHAEWLARAGVDPEALVAVARDAE